MDILRLNAIFQADLKNLLAGCKRASRAVADTAKNIASSTTQAQNAFGKLGSGLDKTGMALQAVGLGMATQQVQAFGMECVTAYGEIESLNKALRATSDGSAAVSDVMKQLKEIAKLPGLGFTDAARSAVLLQGVGLTAKEYLPIIKAFGNAVAASGGGAEELGGTLLGLSQMLAEGKPLMQDFRQMTSRIPMLKSAMEEAFGTQNLDKIQEMGLTAREFVSGLTKELQKLDAVQGGVANDMENLEMSILEMKQSVGQALAPAFTKLANAVTGVTEWIVALPDYTKQLLLWGAGIGTVAIGVTFLATNIANAIRQYRWMTTGIESNTAALEGEADAQEAAMGAAMGDNEALDTQIATMNTLDAVIQRLVGHLDELVVLQEDAAAAATAHAEAQARAATAAGAGAGVSTAGGAASAAGGIGAAVGAAANAANTQAIMRSIDNLGNAAGGAAAQMITVADTLADADDIIEGVFVEDLLELPTRAIRPVENAARGINHAIRPLEQATGAAARQTGWLTRGMGRFRNALGQAARTAANVDVGSLMRFVPQLTIVAAAVAAAVAGSYAFAGWQDQRRADRISEELKPSKADLDRAYRQDLNAAMKRSYQTNAEELKSAQNKLSELYYQMENQNHTREEQNRTQQEIDYLQQNIKAIQTVLPAQKGLYEAEKKRKNEAAEWLNLQYDIQKAELERAALQGGNEDLADYWTAAADAAKVYREEMKEIAVAEKNGEGVQARKYLANAQYQNAMLKAEKEYRSKVEEAEKERRQKALDQEATWLQDRLDALREWAEECRRVHEDYRNEVVGNAKQMLSDLNGLASKGQIALATTASVSATAPELLTPELLKAAKAKTDRDRWADDYNKKLAERYVDNGAEQKYKSITDNIDRAMKVIAERQEEKYAQENNRYLRSILSAVQTMGKQINAQKSVVKA